MWKWRVQKMKTWHSPNNFGTNVPTHARVNHMHFKTNENKWCHIILWISLLFRPIGRFVERHASTKNIYEQPILRSMQKWTSRITVLSILWPLNPQTAILQIQLTLIATTEPQNSDLVNSVPMEFHNPGGAHEIEVPNNITIKGILGLLMANTNPNENGKDVISLGIGDPTAYSCFHTNYAAQEAVVEALCSGKFNGYSPTAGLPQTRM